MLAVQTEDIHWRSIMNNQELATEVTRQVSHLLDQSVVKIEHCLNQLSDKQIWTRPRGSVNSIGNLILHLLGNLRQWGIVPLQGKPRRPGSRIRVQP